jgi:hypothetical protein
MDESLLLLFVAGLSALAAAGAVAVWALRVIWNRLLRRLTRRHAPAVDLRLWVGAMRPRPSAGWCSTHLQRRTLRVAVTSAERTVAAADSAGAPVGDLPALARELRAVQRDLDRRLLLAAAQGRRPDRPTAAQAATTRANADKVRRVAVRALEETAEPAVGRLTARIDAEALAVEAGLANWRRQAEPTRST